VGSGPGGYVAALRAAQLGLRVAIVESDVAGGVCLNWGCIPTKALLSGAELLEAIRGHASAFGIGTGTLTLDYGKAIANSRAVADRLRKGVEGLLRRGGVEWVPGRGRLAGPNTVEVSAPSDTVVEARHIVLATGSSEWVPAGIEVDGDRILTSHDALASRRVPSRLLVIGGGAVGVEFAYVYAMYGSQVTLFEMADQLLPGADHEVARALAASLDAKGIEIQLGARFERLDASARDVRVEYTRAGEGRALDCDRVLLAIGRRPNVSDLGLDAVGVPIDPDGFISTDERHRTAVASVLAIGDVAGGPLLAHKASEQGIAAVEWLAGIERPPFDVSRVPACIYAQPQVASIGWTESEARERLGDVRVGRFPFQASGKAVAAGHPEGFAKLVVDPQYGEIVGAHVIGFGATELIGEICVAMQLESTTRELAHTVHAHPTLSEALMEAALAAEGRALHWRERDSGNASRNATRGRTSV
jgi:dihydrolipoamide dehydrogenase